VPAPGVKLKIKELSRECQTDEPEVCLFLDLPVGTYTLVVANGAKQVKRSVTLPVRCFVSE
jgi:hypothetical protein